MLKPKTPLLQKLLGSLEFVPSLVLGLLLSACVAKSMPPIEQPDTTPSAFTFGPALGAPLNQYAESDIITVNGIDTATPITIEGGEYAIDGGSFRSTATNIFDGQTVQLQLQTSAQPSSAHRNADYRQLSNNIHGNNPCRQPTGCDCRRRSHNHTRTKSSLCTSNTRRYSQP